MSGGWSIVAAAREVGVSRTAGNNWSRGYKTYRRGQVAGFVPALERLAVREISARFLSQEGRIEIADLRHAGLSVRQIADRLGRAPSTVSRELRRNATAGGYRPFEAHRRATARRARSHRRRIETTGELRQLVAELLAQRWSPEQISRHLRLRFPPQRGLQVVTARSLRNNPALAFPEMVWATGNTVVVSTSAASKPLVCFSFRNGQAGPVTGIPARLPPGELAVTGDTVYAADAGEVVRYRFPRHTAEQGVAAVLPPSGSANPGPLAARNLGSQSRRFDTLLQSRALVTEHHLVPADSARNAES